MIQHPDKHQKKMRQGFTLIEVLISIAIIAVLAAILFTLTKSMRDRANNAVSISNIRQMGTILLAMGGDDQGKMYFFGGGIGQERDMPARRILRYLDVPERTNGKQTVLGILHWNAKKMPPKAPYGNPFWFCRAVNMSKITYPDGTIDEWVKSSVKNSEGNNSTMYTMQISGVKKPHLYPLVIDSSGSDGQESFRVTNPPDSHFFGRVGLRNQGKAAAFLMDGSAKFMGTDELRRAGFTSAYDNSVTPPKVVTF